MCHGGEGRRNRRTKTFRDQFEKLPESIRKLAKEAFKAFQRDEFSPALRNHELEDSKKGRHQKGSRAVSVTFRYRAIYVSDDNVNEWYWIGSHEDYNDFTGKT